MLFYTISQFFFYDIENNHDALASYLKIIIGGWLGKHGERGGGGSTAKLSRTVALGGTGGLGEVFGGVW